MEIFIESCPNRMFTTYIKEGKLTYDEHLNCAYFTKSGQYSMTSESEASCKIRNSIKEFKEYLNENFEI